MPPNTHVGSERETETERVTDGERERVTDRERKRERKREHNERVMTEIERERVIKKRESERE